MCKTIKCTATGIPDASSSLKTIPVLGGTALLWSPILNYTGGMQSTIGALPNYQRLWRSTTCLVPGVAYSTAKCSKNTMFAFTIKKLLKKIFVVAKHVRNTGREKITIYIDTGLQKSSFMEQPYISVPVNPRFTPPATFLNATWRQGIFSVMQAMKST